jgi:uncharacterized protein YndB with AHSA1/START domain
MFDILHRVGVKSSSLDNAYHALATRDGLAGWWTKDTVGEDKIGGVMRFSFGDVGFIDMKVVALQPGKQVVWQVVGGPQDWIGTKVIWELKQEDDYVIVLFKHEGWKEPVEFMGHCSTKWAIFLMSLKSMLETGQGAPWPNDTRVSNWH